MAAFQGCDQYVQAQHVESVRIVEKVSYAEVIEKSESARGGQGKCQTQRRQGPSLGLFLGNSC